MERRAVYLLLLLAQGRLMTAPDMFTQQTLREVNTWLYMRFPFNLDKLVEASCLDAPEMIPTGSCVARSYGVGAELTHRWTVFMREGTW